MTAAAVEPPEPPRIEERPLSWLVEDWSLYPRRAVDTTNVRDLVDAIHAGSVLPPIVAEASTGRIIDGFHRSRAYMKVFGTDHEVSVHLREYASDEEAFVEAVRLNRAHGRKLNSSDVIKSLGRLRDMGYDDDDIATIVHIPKARIEQLSVRVAVSSAGVPVPLKGGDRHLRGRTVSQEQIEALNARLGVSYGRHARELIRGIEQNLLPDDAGFWQILGELYEVVGAALAGRSTE